MRSAGPLTHAARPSIVLLMGVAGSGKTTTGRNLARHLGWEFRDADTFHPPANIAKMKGGTPLTDEDRWPWLDAIGSWVDERRRDGTPGIVSCSALRRRYRDRLRAGRPEMAIVFLDGSLAVISERMQRRKGHFMPPDLLQSQFDTLERPTAEEGILHVSITLTPRRVIERIVKELGLGPSKLQV